ncbi:amino acid adenylation domain-containing protein [Nocardia gipuzkoensis]|uniref:amino acid adenylation domain-containing protein n=1 Tax=Nocardia gipuzkoensis TaxID=2749991 RepID=UPI001E34D318|nr:amino acid adenylation domain-containing protein [Nocardia gipuzkoensis]UGT71264.1 amino acid adenylation domain-containing protein [Nocardia gipuzkoensis]
MTMAEIRMEPATFGEADWTDIALAVLVAYQHRMLRTDSITLATQDALIQVHAGSASNFGDLVERVRASRAHAGENESAAAAVHTCVAFREPPVLVENLTFVFDECEGRLVVDVVGNAEQHTREQLTGHATRIAHFAHRLLAVGPNADVAAVELLTPDEYHRIMRIWNDTAHEVPVLTLPELVEANVAAHPDRLAVKHHDIRLTYDELNARANRIARLLSSAGAGSNDIVAMLLPRSIDYVVTALAIVKTGAAYLPVDTGYPVERITQVLSDAGVSHVVTIDDLVDSVLIDVELVVLDNPATVDRLAEADPANLVDTDRRVPLNPDAPAYVLYTSGSTGRPKGVVVAHKAITNRLHHMQHQIPLGPDDLLLQKTPAGFDVTVREVFWPLLAGAALVVADPDGHRDPLYLAETIVAEGITVAHFVPSGLKMFLQEPAAIGCTSLRTVVCGGEALPAELQAWFAAVLPANLYNVYGPTEAAVDVTSMLCPRDPEPGPVLIGRPVWNTKLYVLDEQQRLLPPGVIGELYLAGVQLAEGYLGRPELTADRFLEDPYGEPGDRMYRSGDAARWREDGEIEFFGRLDHQVKIRGFRVELGEIESVLLRDGQLSQAVCLVREDTPGDQRLVAYVVSATGRTPDVTSLRARAEAALPDYMVPTAFVVLDKLPLTSNEKLDRTALPKPDRDVAPEGRAPASPEEQRVAELFATVLGVHRVGVDQNFFDLGGNSVLAGKLIQEVHESCGVRLRIKHILENPSVQALAALIHA